jgi:predicted nucleic acid-binding protein
VFRILVDSLLTDARVTIVPPTKQLFDQGIDLYDSRPDKEWSLTDCISFVVMQQLQLSEALTGDRHFEQAGFRALLK